MLRKALFFSLSLAAFLTALSAVSVFAQPVLIGTESASVTASVSALPSVDENNGGITGGIRAGVRFSGLAYPHAIVSLLKGTTPLATTTADAMGKFSFTFTDIGNAASLFFVLFAHDTDGMKSTLLNFPVVFHTGVLTDISGIRLAPTITTDKLAVKQGDYISIHGNALPKIPIELIFQGPQEKMFIVTSDSEGAYKLTVPLSIARGEYILKARYENDSRTSVALRIIVGEASILRVEVSANIPGDCNLDERVTLIDFSVLAFWFGKPKPPHCVDTNNDGIINLKDFSILAFYWNG